MQYLVCEPQNSFRWILFHYEPQICTVQFWGVKSDFNLIVCFNEGPQGFLYSVFWPFCKTPYCHKFKCTVHFWPPPLRGWWCSWYSAWTVVCCSMPSFVHVGLHMWMYTKLKRFNTYCIDSVFHCYTDTFEDAKWINPQRIECLAMQHVLYDMCFSSTVLVYTCMMTHIIVIFDVSIIPVVWSTMVKVAISHDETKAFPNVIEFGGVYAFALGIHC